MKKKLCLLLASFMVFSLLSCSKEPAPKKPDPKQNTDAKIEQVVVNTTDADMEVLERLYAGLEVHHGQLHEHSDSGRRSDGEATLQDWKDLMPQFDMDFAALLDHRQTDHMYHEDWDPALFISGTEAMAYIIDRDKDYNKFHYNMIFHNVEDMETLLLTHDDTYHFANGMFRYGGMLSEKFTQIIEDVLELGGFFVIAHPVQTKGVASDDALDYYFCDGVGYEVFYHIYGQHGPRALQTKINYDVYVALLAAGKKVYATAGCDSHSVPTERGLTTIYAAEALDTAYVSQLNKGNFTAGPVGVRMSVGETVMGGTTDFNGQRVVISVGDFHESFRDGSYRLKVFSDKGEVLSVDLKDLNTAYFAFDADESATFYRVEIHDTTLSDFTLLAMGNPIWND